MGESAGVSRLFQNEISGHLAGMMREIDSYCCELSLLTARQIEIHAYGNTPALSSLFLPEYRYTRWENRDFVKQRD